MKCGTERIEYLGANGSRPPSSLSGRDRREGYEPTLLIILTTFGMMVALVKFTYYLITMTIFGVTIALEKFGKGVLMGSLATYIMRT